MLIGTFLFPNEYYSFQTVPMCLTIRLSASYSTCLFIVLSKERAETTILRASAHSKKGLSGSGPDVLVQGFNNITRAFLLNLILIPIITPAPRY